MTPTEDSLTLLREALEENGYEDTLIFTDFDYADAFIGVSDDERAVYDYDKMVDWLIEKEGFTLSEAVEWIDYNTMRALPYGGEGRPIVVYPIDIREGR